jgi:hypothetical protein
MSRLKSLEAKVRQVMVEIPQTRNCDKLLAWNVWEKFYFTSMTYIQHSSESSELGITMLSFLELPSQSEIQRIRARIQNEEHTLLPTERGIVKLRRQNMEVWEKYMGYHVDDKNQLQLKI